MCIYAVHDAPIIFFQKEESEHYIYICQGPDQNLAQFEIGPAQIPILIWAGPNPNSDLGWTNLELGQPRSQF